MCLIYIGSDTWVVIGNKLLSNELYKVSGLSFIHAYIKMIMSVGLRFCQFCALSKYCGAMGSLSDSWSVRHGCFIEQKTLPSLLIVLVGSRNGFKCDFTIEGLMVDWHCCPISTLVLVLTSSFWPNVGQDIILRVRYKKTPRLYGRVTMSNKLPR